MAKVCVCANLLCHSFNSLSVSLSLDLSAWVAMAMLIPECVRPLISPTIRMVREFEANHVDCCGKANGTPQHRNLSPPDSGMDRQIVLKIKDFV